MAARKAASDPVTFTTGMGAAWSVMQQSPRHAWTVGPHVATFTTMTLPIQQTGADFIVQDSCSAIFVVENRMNYFLGYFDPDFIIFDS